MMMFGKSDPIIPLDFAEEMMYSHCRGKQKVHLHPRLKNNIEKEVQLRHGLTIDAECLQDYFCFIFEKTGHNVHRRRATEISIMLRVYITVIRQIDLFESENEAKL